MLPFLADLPPSFIITLAFLFGLAFGSFLNVVIYRLPLGENPAWPASHCPACQKPLAWSDNIPLLSFVLSRGRCRQCNQPISWRYPLVELLTASLWAGMAWHYGASWQLLWALAFSLFLLALAFIDAAHHLLPDVLTYPLLLFGFIASVARQFQSVSLVTFDFSFGAEPEAFVRWKVALYGALLLACAAPCLLVLDWLDGLLFDRYFVEEEAAPLEAEAGEQTNEETTEAETIDAETTARHEAIENACAEQRSRVVLTAFIVGLVLAVIWALWIALDRKSSEPTLSLAYDGITNALAGALVAGGIIWMLRAAYFWLRHAEGMGLGDVKMMAGVGAYLGWISSFGVLLYGSILGAFFGIIIAFRRTNRWQTLLPFGTCLAFAALLVLLQS